MSSAAGPKASSRLAVYSRHVAWALRSSLGRLAQRPLATAMTMLVLGLAMAMPLLLWLLLANTNRVLDNLGEGHSMTVFLSDGADAAAAEALAEALRARGDVAAVQARSPDQGLAELAALQGFAEVLEGLPHNPLPWVLLVQPAGSDGGQANAALAKALRDMPEVDQVQDQAQWRARLRALLDLGRRGFVLLAALLVLAMLLVVCQSVRQDVRSRAEEITVLELAGASARFVRRPYLLAGAAYGLGAGVLAVILVLLCQGWLAGPAQTLARSYSGQLPLHGLSVGLLLAVPLAAVVLGWLGARLALAMGSGRA